MNKEDIEKYLRMLGEELQKKVIGEVLLVGGAVMLLEVFKLIVKYTRQQNVETRVQYIVEELFDV